ncbi:MAG: CoA transferase [Burkholderiaceae bacterium]|nr:CoA transferase [Burkholderiaceae bacterium]
MTTLPLAGVRILSLAEQYPGPYATMLLADLGADVIMVERPVSGDPSRRFPGLFASFNRNKRSVVLDLKSAQGHADFLKLVDTADVVIEGYRPGVMARLQLSAELLRDRKPSLVFVSISSFGQNGPRASVAGHDLSIQAAAGMINVAPGQEAGAALPVLPLADISSAMFAALGVVTALFARSGSGRGASIDVSMLDSLVSWMTPFLVPPMNNLPTRPLPPLDPGYGLFATADGLQITLSIAGEDNMWMALCNLLDLQQFAGLCEEDRCIQAQEIEPHLRAAIAEYPYDTLYEQLELRGIAFGPVLGLHQVLSDPQMVARDMTQQVVGTNGVQKFVRQPLMIDGDTGSISRPVPQLGEHNRELLSPSLTMSEH